MEWNYLSIPNFNGCAVWKWVLFCPWLYNGWSMKWLWNSFPMVKLSFLTQPKNDFLDTRYIDTSIYTHICFVILYKPMTPHCLKKTIPALGLEIWAVPFSCDLVEYQVELVMFHVIYLNYTHALPRYIYFAGVCTQLHYHQICVLMLYI